MSLLSWISPPIRPRVFFYLKMLSLMVSSRWPLLLSDRKAPEPTPVQFSGPLLARGAFESLTDREEEHAQLLLLLGLPSCSSGTVPRAKSNPFSQAISFLERHDLSPSTPLPNRRSEVRGHYSDDTVPRESPTGTFEKLSHEFFLVSRTTPGTFPLFSTPPFDTDLKRQCRSRSTVPLLMKDFPPDRAATSTFFLRNQTPPRPSGHVLVRPRGNGPPRQPQPLRGVTPQSLSTCVRSTCCLVFDS